MININIEYKLNGNTFHPQDVVIDTKLGEIYNVASFSVIRPPNLNDEVEFIIGDFSCKGFVHKISENIGKYTVEVRSYGAKLSSPYSKNIRTIISGANTTELLEKISPMIDSRLPEYKTFGGVAREGTLKSVIDNLVGFMKPDIYANKDKIIIYPRRGTDGEAIKVNDDKIIGNINVDVQQTDDVCGSVIVAGNTALDDDYPNVFTNGSSYGSTGGREPNYKVIVSNGIAKIYINKKCVVGIDGVSEKNIDDCSEIREKITEQIGLSTRQTYFTVRYDIATGGASNSAQIDVHNNSGLRIFVSKNITNSNGVDINASIDECTARVEYETIVYCATPLYSADGSYHVIVSSKCGDDLIVEGIDHTYLGTSEKCGISLPYEISVNIMSNFNITIEEARLAVLKFNGIEVRGNEFGMAYYTVNEVGIIKVECFYRLELIGSVTYKVQ